ncbi:MAG TPA: DUF433 domain-containing protein [Pyrinomonadaceae bacterium]|nr:DUF433 domain-containing protein [Pyrinomonadaceae bacterium]
MDLIDRITIDPNICHGKPTIRGLRYPVETILELLSSGMTVEQVVADYEDLERDDILAALAYAAKMTHLKRIDLAASKRSTTYQFHKSEWSLQKMKSS